MNTSPPRPASGRPARTAVLTAAAAAGCLLVTGCSGSGTTRPAADTGATRTARLRIAMVSHGDRGDAFWDRVRKGAEDAAAKDDVELTYANDPDGPGQAELVRNAIRDKVDGIAVTLAKPEAMKAPVSEAKKAGIPVVALNSGIDDWKSSGALEYFGQDESVAGRAVGDKLNGLKAKRTLCVIHERGNIALEARCAGVKKTFAGQTSIAYVDGTDMNSVTESVAARLRQEPGIDEVVTNGAQFALAAVKSVKEAGSRARVATFDLNDDLVKAVRSDDVQFAVDQQPYLQGYLAVDALWLYRTNGNISGGGESPVLTGPAFVTRANVADVARFAANGTR
ncbi:sugar ABC transporter substrate-binding protein [Streptomyces sp. NPDC006012]|uniref:sugar ABC transporter substrate-binding protein n=1 Tax=Streptomyces sp. NPDC006012 TaxID=3364739 RepID=UPI0036822120